MNCTTNDLTLIISGLKDIPFELAWYQGEGHYENNGHNVDANEYVISMYIEIKGYSMRLPSGFMEEQEWTPPEYKIEIYTFIVFNPEGERLILNKKQRKSIEHNLLKNIFVE